MKRGEEYILREIIWFDINCSFIPQAIFSEIRSRIDTLIKKPDYLGVLALYDNKGLLSEAAQIFGLKNRKEAEELIGRTLRSDSAAQLMTALVTALPKVTRSST
jgi:hypothetical protein